jgi:hypothetical protein
MVAITTSSPAAAGRDVPSSLFLHVGCKCVDVTNYTATVKPNVDGDIGAAWVFLELVDRPSDLMFVIPQTCPFLIVNKSESTSTLVEIVYSEEMARPLTRPHSIEFGLSFSDPMIRLNGGAPRDLPIVRYLDIAHCLELVWELLSKFSSASWFDQTPLRFDPRHSYHSRAFPGPLRLLGHRLLHDPMLTTRQRFARPEG